MREFVEELLDQKLEKLISKRPAERNYNFYGSVGQFIEHVDTVNFRMDHDGTFHFENVGQVNGEPCRALRWPCMTRRGNMERVLDI